MVQLGAMSCIIFSITRPLRSPAPTPAQTDIPSCTSHRFFSCTQKKKNSRYIKPNIVTGIQMEYRTYDHKSNSDRPKPRRRANAMVAILTCTVRPVPTLFARHCVPVRPSAACGLHVNIYNSASLSNASSKHSMKSAAGKPVLSTAVFPEVCCSRTPSGFEK